MQAVSPALVFWDSAERLVLSRPVAAQQRGEGCYAALMSSLTFKGSGRPSSISEYSIPAIWCVCRQCGQQTLTNSKPASVSVHFNAGLIWSQRSLGMLVLED